MSTHQGDLALLDDPVAQRLLQSTIPARLAYNWHDGTPRVIPIGFHWTGTEIALGTPPDAPKMKALHNGAKVALTVDSDSMPYKVLMVRGSVRTDTVEGIAPEYETMTKRVLGEEQGQAWLENMRPISHGWRASSLSRSGSASSISRPVSRVPWNGQWNKLRPRQRRTSRPRLGSTSGSNAPLKT